MACNVLRFDHGQERTPEDRVPQHIQVSFAGSPLDWLPKITNFLQERAKSLLYRVKFGQKASLLKYDVLVAPGAMHHVIHSNPAHGRNVIALTPGTHDDHFLSVEITHDRPPGKWRGAEMWKAGSRLDLMCPDNIQMKQSTSWEGQIRSSKR
jgi:hypothetical protein